MSSILDNAILVGKEVTYGTPVALARGYEAKADTWQREQEALESVGFRAGQHALRSDRRKQINMGAAGVIELDALSNGLGLLLQGVFGSSAIAQQAATAAWKQTHQTTSDASTASYTIQKLVSDNAGVLDAYTYHGSVITEFSLSQDVGGLLVANFSFDSEDEDTSTAAGTPVYPAAGKPFDWTQALVEVNSIAQEAQSFSFSANMGLKTDRRFLRNSALKRQPKRTAMPEYTGEMAIEFANATLYDAFVAGTIMPIVATWRGPLIAATYYEEIKLTMAACQFDGSTPTGSLDDMTNVALPFKVLYNGTDPAVKLEYTSTDVAY